MKEARVLFYVQHLLGIGHLRRALTLVDAMGRHGLQVTMVSGGVPVLGMVSKFASFVQLPPASTADLSFRQLVDAKGLPVTEEWKQMRRQRLLDVLGEVDPHAVVLELFPFGRRQMRFELLPLLEAASRRKPVPVLVSSVRDVLGGGQKEPAKQDQMLLTFDRYFDHLLVHGDPDVIPFGATFHHAARLADRLHYTGYVVEQGAVPPKGTGAGPAVLVSAGGGAVGYTLMANAIAAHGLSRLGDRRWLLLAGLNCGDTELAELRALAWVEAGDGIQVERHRGDFVALLGSCRVSVSQGGYNTVMETLGVGARAVLVPFAGGSETEQGLRARLLAQRGWLGVVEEAVLSPVALAMAIDAADLRADSPALTIDMRGAQRSAELLTAWIEARFS